MGIKELHPTHQETINPYHTEMTNKNVLENTLRSHLINLIMVNNYITKEKDMLFQTFSCK